MSKSTFGAMAGPKATGEAPRIGESRLDADTIVCPLLSSTSWAVICRSDRVTTRRGRSAVPRSVRRTRKCRRARATRRVAEIPPEFRRLSSVALTPSPRCAR